MSKQAKKIQDYDKVYAFLRHYVDFCLKLAYRRIKYTCLEKVPADGAVIYAPNHTNALMDALIILAMDRKQKVFVARADIFKNPKVAKILRFLKIMPIMRIRDGMEEVRKNTEIIHKSVDVLLDKVPFCILPEGRHQAKHSLLPLSKGIFRIAIEAEEIMGDQMPLYIVPVGLEYGNFFRYRSTVLIQVGDPINVSQFIREHSDLTQPELMNLMKDELAERMKEIILYIPDDEYYDATLDACAAVINQQVDIWRKEHPRARRHALTTRFAANKMTLERIAHLRAEEPEKAAELLDKASAIHRERTARGISLSSVTARYPFWSRLLKVLILLVTLPYTLPVAVLNLPITGVSAFLFSKMKDRAFFNSIRFVMTLVLWPLLLIIYAVVLYCTLPWEWALGFSLALIPGTVAVQEAWRLLRLTVSDIKLLCAPGLRRAIRNLRLRYTDIVSAAE
ncbi:MAG TPA: 1-acyl-sn-glycerol-3-phosphate acyltransferase [Candidatus Coprenecus pullistercoris]|nr:1-acyl-sn-glycerol-3-phosphate acyltransferase [Candidatus Coprenecus pullistercoris]